VNHTRQIRTAKAKTDVKRLKELLYLALDSVDLASSHVEFDSWEHYYLARARDALMEAIRLMRGDM